MNGIERIAVERKRQIEAEGYTLQEDKQYGYAELIRAAKCYLALACLQGFADYASVDHYRRSPSGWPFPKSAWKPSRYAERNLEKAGALIAAELDRRSNPNEYSLGLDMDSLSVPAVADVIWVNGRKFVPAESPAVEKHYTVHIGGIAPSEVEKRVCDALRSIGAREWSESSTIGAVKNAPARPEEIDD